MPEPPGVVTTTLTAPADPDGVVQSIVLALTTVMPVALDPPKVTLIAPMRFVPLTTTAAPPARGPAAGETLPTVGLGAVVPLGHTGQTGHALVDASPAS